MVTEWTVDAAADSAPAHKHLKSSWVPLPLGLHPHSPSASPWAMAESYLGHLSQEECRLSCPGPLHKGQTEQASCACAVPHLGRAGLEFGMGKSKAAKHEGCEDHSVLQATSMVQDPAPPHPKKRKKIYWRVGIAPERQEGPRVPMSSLL